ncbi:methionyl-tRNA formyltransferase [Teredinibacter turnerae]|uniref:methionyl-tRNA formyltransferase n=1 Tax=Teredinibacter turnerae TaxID=2426 RepID=UPI00037A1646|nr:methionyl-tRNA formyltransferase [Teredinibacter turnerae]
MNSHRRKLIFAGTPEFAAAHLRALLASEHDIVAVYTQPDRPAGRGKKLTASPVKTLAQEHDLPVYQPASLRSAEAQAELAALGAEVMIVVAYGLILPQAVLDAPRLGCLNVHGSILPRWRGAAPIQRAIEAGDTYSGVTIMQMDAGLDTGAMLLKRECPIQINDTASDLHDRLAELGPPALLDTLAQLEDLTPEAQDDTQANYAHKIEKAEALLNWRLPAVQLHRQIRAFNPFPICYTMLNGDRLRIHSAELCDMRGEPGAVLVADRDRLVIACGEASLAVTRLQLPGKKAMTPAEFANGHSHLCPVGARLSDTPQGEQHG